MSLNTSLWGKLPLSVALTRFACELLPAQAQLEVRASLALFESTLRTMSLNVPSPKGGAKAGAQLVPQPLGAVMAAAGAGAAVAAAALHQQQHQSLAEGPMAKAAAKMAAAAAGGSPVKQPAHGAVEEEAPLYSESGFVLLLAILLAVSLVGTWRWRLGMLNTGQGRRACDAYALPPSDTTTQPRNPSPLCRRAGGGVGAGAVEGAVPVWAAAQPQRGAVALHHWRPAREHARQPYEGGAAAAALILVSPRSALSAAPSF